LRVRGVILKRGENTEIRGEGEQKRKNMHTVSVRMAVEPAIMGVKGGKDTNKLMRWYLERKGKGKEIERKGK
jgi:hypothetical protein